MLENITPKYAHLSFDTRPARMMDKVFQLTVNYNKTFTELVEAGCYDLVDEGMEERYPIFGRGTKHVVAHVLTAGKQTIREIHLRMARKKLRPANMVELLTFGATYPEEQTHGTIFTFGALANIRYTEDDSVYLVMPGLTRNQGYKARILYEMYYSNTARSNPYWGYMAVEI